MNSPQILFQFGRSKVGFGEFTDFLSRYALDRVPHGRPLRDIMGSMAFMIGGFDNGARELRSVP